MAAKNCVDVGANLKIEADIKCPRCHQSFEHKINFMRHFQKLVALHLLDFPPNIWRKNYFFKNGPNPASFCLFSFFSQHNYFGLAHQQCS